MRWSTHVAIGVNLAGVAIVAAMPALKRTGLSADRMGAMALGAVLGSLLPDLDARESKIKYLKLGRFRPFHLLSTVTYQHLGHRGVLHSLLGMTIAATITAAFTPWSGVWSALGLVLGYAAHLLADSATVMGIPWLFPNKHRHHLLKRRLRVVTGSLAEEGIFAIAGTVALSFLIWLLNQR